MGRRRDRTAGGPHWHVTGRSDRRSGADGDDPGRATIGREELKAKLDRGDEFELVMTIDEFSYRQKHIPGSIHVQSKAEGLERLDRDDEIVVYCAQPGCIASRRAYDLLVDHGYEDVRRFPGGIAAWEAAGYPIAGRRGSASDRSTPSDP